MLISSAKNLTIENCIALTVYVLHDQDSDEFLTTFELIVPDDEVDIAQYDALIDGIEYAQFKMNKLMDSLDYEEEEKEEEEDEADE